MAVDDYIKNIPDPDPVYMRNLEKGAARDGRIAQTACPHPMSAIQQFVDTESKVHRNGRPTNLFQCSICKRTLWLVDAWGKEAAEG